MKKEMECRKRAVEIYKQLNEADQQQVVQVIAKQKYLFNARRNNDLCSRFLIDQKNSK